MKALVSVVMPAYNARTHIGEAIAGVLAQSYGDLELVIVDDGSVDGTGDVVRSFDDVRIRLIRTDNRGNYHARNTALVEARGSLIAFIDADDVWDTGKVQAQVDSFERSPDIGLCCTDHYVFTQDDPGKLFIDPLHGFREEYYRHDSFLDSLILENGIITSSVMIARCCLDKLGIFDTAYQNAMDYELWLRIMFNYRARYLKERLVRKRVHPGNISRNQVTSQRAVLYICRKMDTFMRHTPFYRSHHRDLFRRKMQETMYALGMEYLGSREYELAAYYLSKCNPAGKGFFLAAARTAALIRFDPFVSFVDAYRRHRRKRNMTPVRP